jgi:hypothetical protein
MFHLAMQIKFLRAFLRLTTLDKIRNTEIRARLNVKNVVQEYQRDWVKLVDRMRSTRLPQQILKYKPAGRRDQGRTRVRRRDQIHHQRQEQSQ